MRFGQHLQVLIPEQLGLSFIVYFSNLMSHTIGVKNTN